MNIETTVLSLAVVVLACSKRAEPTPQQQPAPNQEAQLQPSFGRDPSPPAAAQPPLAALLDVQRENEAIVVALVVGGTWQAPSVAGKAAVERLVKRGAAYRLFPAGSTAAAEPTAAGALSGKLREDCGEFYPELAGPAAARGFAAISTADAGDAVAGVPLRSVKIEPRDTAAVAAVIDRASKLKVTPRIERAYRVDLDGNGKLETILQATHPDLLGDPPAYKHQYYSLVVVLPDGDGQPVMTGYLQAARELAQFQVLTVDSVADVDRDGKRELLIRARSAEGWQTQVFRYNGKALTELFRSTGGEGECPGGGGE